MTYNESDFLNAVKQSFKAYKEKGPRSTAKLKPLHKFVAESLKEIWGEGFDIHYLGEDTREAKVEGKYYPKDIDIAVYENDKPVFCLGVKFVISNYKQNANNYFENMMGETANIQANNLPYAHLIILRQPTPYYNRDGVLLRFEIINDHDIKKYSVLIFENKQAHRPMAMAIPILKIDENTDSIPESSDLKMNFSKPNVDILNGKLSLENMFKEIIEYKNFYLSTKS